MRTALPPCRPEQVQLTISAYGPRPIAFLRHVNGPSCDLGFLHVRVSARGPDGQDPLADVEIPPGGDVLEGALARGGELAIETPTYEALCARTRDRGVPFRVRVRIGLYRAQRIITCP